MFQYIFQWLNVELLLYSLGMEVNGAVPLLQ